MRPTTVRAIGCLGVAFVLLIGCVLVVTWFVGRSNTVAPVPGQQRCVASAGNTTVAIDLEQAGNAAIISGVSQQRGLAARAVSIALATAYQESRIRNIDHGDRDSLGLFQQRPSQGWGTPEQIMDPYYSSGKFYESLVKVDDWETGDINDVAQEVQRSGHPDAYRQHEANARALASTLTGHSPGGLTCLDSRGADPNAEGLLARLDANLGETGGSVEAGELVVTTDDELRRWSVAHQVVLHAGRYGVTSVHLDGMAWTQDDHSLPAWVEDPEEGDAGTVVITFG
ncbi:MAG: hypothetical protein ACTH2Q_05265 [Propionibacteriaceae bacterium]